MALPASQYTKALPIGCVFQSTAKYLVKLLETGQILQLPKVGRHRRVARAAVLKYKRTEDAQRESALKELAALSQRHRPGY